MRHPRLSRVFSLSLSFAAIVAGSACTEPSGPETLDPPSGVTAVLASPTSARITWTASPQSDEVARTKTTIVITKHGRPVARLVPCGPSPAARGLAGSVLKEVGDPFGTGEAWDADAS